MEEQFHVQVKDNSPSIEHILRPISYTSWLLGVGVARPRKCPKFVTIILRIIQLVVCSISIICGMMDALIFTLKSDIFEYIHCVNKVLCYVSTYYYVCHGIRQYDKWPKLMDKIKKLDQKIRRETLMNNRSIKIVEALAILATFICCPLALIVYALYYSFTYPEEVFVSDLLMHYIIAQSLVNSFVFDVVIYVLYHRFQTINKLIGQLDVLSNGPWIALKIRRIRELHTGTCDLVVMVNDIYSLSFLFCSANCFTMVLATLFKIYVIVVEKNYAFIVLNNILFIVYLAQFGLLCWICTLARRESDRTGRIIYEVMLNCKPVNLDKLDVTGNQSSIEIRPPLEDQESEPNSKWSSSHNLSYVAMENLLHKNLGQDYVRNEINDFSIQLQQHRIAFTACDFFEINNALFSRFVGVIATYLIIFIQFYQQPDLDSSLFQHILKIF
ncbi:uncharacterized protein LOC105835628 [Monomorium pharaonis]|uniref:uncharacterized protein LOC105835628 n=1 Tax=Monomorium pharaonis TaxID=307658 RepID=UPI00063F8426|nr:uncharacterized protein LOC105835628 [Monomorium pharaonis]XP_036146819.1 uncharacterized protein LOC105835628 [Monomorium pharaonis]XP_036146820.1 uncharacterized protein LOC105835628 [Monomorium pharaonis]XP_036146821.1 uncharacterized protein LOC105835628 [Monomorium pharaonis]